MKEGDEMIKDVGCIAYLTDYISTSSNFPQWYKIAYYMEPSLKDE